MKTKQQFEADDGKTFDTREECEAYERWATFNKLAGLSTEQIEAAVTYQDKELCRLFEQVGRQCAAARVEAGDVSTRGRKKAEEPAAPAAEAEQPAAEAEGENPAGADVTSITKGRKKAA